MTTDLAKITTQLEQAPAAETAEFHETVTFPNGRGVSIIRNQWSYGGSRGLFELAVLDRKGDVDFSTPVTPDVLGHLDIPGVLQAMKAVADLPHVRPLEPYIAG